METPKTYGWDHTPTLEEMLAYNTQFVEKKEYEQYATDKYPAKKLAVLTCMDTRLTTLLPAALGLKNGDAKIIKNAGKIPANSLKQLGKCSCKTRVMGL